jgi:hypothetical protein
VRLAGVSVKVVKVAGRGGKKKKGKKSDYSVWRVFLGFGSLFLFKVFNLTPPPCQADIKWLEIVPKPQLPV